MLNRFSSTIEFAADSDSADLGMDQRPGLRLAVLFGAMVLAAGAIGARLAYVQLALGSDFTAEFARTVEKHEPIPSRDGRILTAGGEVLAEDVELFGIKAHYRWIENPPNPTWLKQQALSKLDRSDRRKPERVRREIEAIERQHAALWQRLAILTGTEATGFNSIRNGIQTRVEHIHQTVDSRRQEQDAPQITSPATSGPWWQAAWDRARHALTTPPHREALEPLVIQEELDYHPIVPEVTLAVAAEIESHPDLYPGLRIELSTRRRYTRGTLAPHVIGYRTTINDDTLSARRKRFPQGDPLDYKAGDRVGMAGLERYYERHLRGLRGERKLILNRAGEVIRTEVVRRPKLGRDLVLTLNVAAQQAAETLLDEVLTTRTLDEKTGKPMPIPQGGAIVALDVRTGAVLASASAPRFDVNALVTHDQEAWKRIVSDARKPLFSRATHMALPPGSTFKIVTAAAYLQQGTLDPEASFHCQGYLDTPEKYRCYTFRNFGVGHGDVNLADALARSCNVYFFAAARRSGPEALHEWAAKFGFGVPTGIDLPGERSGNLPHLPVAPRRGKRRLSGDTLGMAIGQAQLTATPLQVTRMVAAVANGGKLVTPRLVESYGTMVQGDDSPLEGLQIDELSAPEPQSIPDLSPRTLDWVRLGLKKVVSDPHGTGYKTVRLAEVAIAGKTGTAEPGGDRPDHAWFVGYAPADQPRVAFVVVLEHAGSGGHAAGPVARKFVETLLQQGLLTGNARPTAPSAN